VLHLLALLTTTILGIILKPLPMGAVAFLGLTATVLTGTLKTDEALSGFGDPTIWLIVGAFFIARGFTKTGLGSRLAFHFLRFLGRRTLGLAYGLAITDLCLAPAIPSNTARAGGIIMPILRSLAKASGSDPGLGTQDRVGSFLVLSAFHANVITGAMFLTAMAANPLAASLASNWVTLSWGLWAKAALVPGLASLFLVPWLLFKLDPPQVKETSGARDMALRGLAELGPMGRDEKIMGCVFLLLVGLWIFGDKVGVGATATALGGLSILMATGVLEWREVVGETGAWDTMVWFAALITMAGYLNAMGLASWFALAVGAHLGGNGWMTVFLPLVLLYFFTHYLFAGSTAQVGAMYSAFLALAIGAKTPPLLAALVLGFVSNLFAGLTHYGNGPATVLFGTGFVEVGRWWRTGLLVSLVCLGVWLGLGGLWWKWLGLW
jgi:DASS family divalent anion:Na+ symporter